MRCSTAEKKISDYIDNELDSVESRSLQEHMDGCVQCQKIYQDLTKIKQGAEGLVELSPTSELWFKIASQVREKSTGSIRPVRTRQRRFLLSPNALGWAVGAALLLVIVVGAVTFGPGLWKSEPGSQKYVLAQLENAERHYQKAIEALWKAVSAQKDKFDPQLYAVFQKNLDIIDDSILACKQAVLARPDSIDSRNYLMAAYKQKRTLLEEMMVAPTSPVEQRDVGSIY